MDIKSVIQNRYSCRKFMDERISDEVLNDILSIIKYVPSAKNQQPTKVLVLNRDDEIEKLNTCVKTYGAKTVLVITSDKESAWHSPLEDYNSYEMDASIVCDELMLYASSIGIGSCWIRYFNSVDVKNALGITNDVICLLPIGIPDVGPGPLHEVTKSDNELFEIRG